MMLCANCGMDNPQENRYCLNCGKALESDQPSEPRTISFIKTPSSGNQQKPIVIVAVVGVIALCACLAILVLAWNFGDDALKAASALTTTQRTPTRTPTRTPASSTPLPTTDSSTTLLTATP